MLRSFKLVVAGLAALAIAACATVRVDETSFFWPESRVQAQGLKLPSNPPPAAAETLPLSYAGGPIGASLVRGPGADRPLILFCGGNLFRRASAGGSSAAKLLPFGDVLMWDYPGYGDTAGEATLAAFRAAGEVVAAEARARADREGRRLILWGHSLGGVVCGQGVALARPDALVLEATTPSARAAVDAQAGLARSVVRFELSPDLAAASIPEALRGYGGKVVVLEAGRDQTLSPRLSRQLEGQLRAQGVRVERLAFPNAGHNDIGRQPDFQARVAAALAN